jgi:S-adenosylmethionine:tRNA ribosyltransferase-isomerase
VKAALFDYVLPEELIAQHPPAERDGARLLVLACDGLEHRWVRDLCELIPSGALVVLNETRVRRARLFGRRPSGEGGAQPVSSQQPVGSPQQPVGSPQQAVGKVQQGGGRVEFLLLGPTPLGTWRALGRANRPLRLGDVVEIPSEEAVVAPSVESPRESATGPAVDRFRVLDKEPDGTLVLRPEARDGSVVPPEAVERALEQQGHIPLPPYMRRPDEAGDAERYQTVFARELGSVAAPTAGLHLTERSLARLEERGVALGRLVLHVGVGTFRPVTADDFDQHDMHSEHLEVSPKLVEQVARARSRGAPVVAIGTTAVRALESAADPERPGHVVAFAGSTNLLIQPGYRFRVVDSLLTNFHMPKSTLLALVSAFAGRERVLAAYQEAVERKYRFLSYGDAMWLPRRCP